jgi:hypothetical protein
MPRARFAEILRLLADHDVEFVVVGMTAGILHGAPVTTVDLDVVHRRSPENVARLPALSRGISSSRPATAISTASARSTRIVATRSCSSRRWR